MANQGEAQVTCPPCSGHWEHAALQHEVCGESRAGLTLVEVVIVVAVVGCLFALVIPAVHRAREAARASACIGGNSKQFAIALFNYHETYESFPQAFVRDGSGRPVHSWRVLALPFMDRGKEYSRYNFAKPWDAIANRKLIDSLGQGSAFKCPSAPQQNWWMTDFMAVVGPNTIWPDDGSSVRLSDATDGAANTVLFAEVDNSGVHRGEPRDFHVLQMSYRINPRSGQGFSSPHPGYTYVIFADGRVKKLQNAVSTDVVRALITRNGGEDIQLREEGRTVVSGSVTQ